MLEVRELYSGYGEALVVRGVSLDVGASEIVAVLGRNGMGKTTLIRSIMGLTPPQFVPDRSPGAARASSACGRMILLRAKSRSCHRGGGCFRR